MIPQRVPILQGGPDAYLDFDFRFGQEAYWLNRQRYGDFSLVPGATSTGGAGFGAVQRNGVWQSVDANAPLIGDGGLGVWEARTNSIRNPVGAGAVAGTPGTMPTNWSSGPPPGLTRSVVGLGVEAGLPYVDCRYSGTHSGGGLAEFAIDFDAMTQVAATQGQTWSAPTFVALRAGAWPSSASVSVIERGAAGVFLSSTGANLAGVGPMLTRVAPVRLLTNPTAAFVQASARFNIGAGEVVDFTIRIAAPNLKLGPDINDPPILQESGLPATRTAVAQSVEVALPAAGWIFAEALVPANMLVTTRIIGSNGGTNGVVGPLSFRTNGAVETFNGLSGALINGTTNAAGQMAKAAVTWDATGRALTSKGAVPVSDANPLGSFTQLTFGRTGAGNNMLNSTISRVVMGVGRLSDAALQALTA